MTETEHLDAGPEHLRMLESPSEVEQCFNAVARTEMHALTFALMATEQESLSRKDSRKLFMDAQGPAPVWEVAPNLIFEYARGNFVPAGLASVHTEKRKLDNRKEPVDVLVAKVDAPTDRLTLALAVSGVVMDWSLGQTAISLRDIAGESRSSASENAIGSTIARKRILERLIEKPGASQVDLSEHAGIHENTIGALLQDMEVKRIVEVSRAEDWEHRMFTLNGKGYSHKAITRDMLVPETRAVYDMVDILSMTGVEQISAEDLFHKINGTFEGLDKARLQHILAQVLAGRQEDTQGNDSRVSRHIPALESQGRLHERGKTGYVLSEDSQTSVSSLLADLARLEARDPELVTAFASRALEIVSDPELVKSLTMKARRSAPQKNLISDQELLELVKAAVVEEGSMTIRALSQIAQQRGVKMSAKGFADRIGGLRNEGLITTEARPVSEKSRRVTSFVTGVTSKG